MSVVGVVLSFMTSCTSAPYGKALGAAGLCGRTSSLILLASGQSNFARRPKVDPWSPPPNLLVWDWRQSMGEVGGSQFVSWPGRLTNLPVQIAAEYARAHPETTIYLIVLAKNGLSLSHWTGDAEPDMWKVMKTNLPVALRRIVKTSVDAFFWWQGEKDAGEPPGWYSDHFESLVGKMRTEGWLRIDTPIVLFSPNMRKSRYSRIWHELTTIAAVDKSRRQILQLENFDFSDGTHLDPSEYPAAASFTKRILDEDCRSHF